VTPQRVDVPARASRPQRDPLASGRHQDGNGEALNTIGGKPDLPFPFGERERISERGRLLANLVSSFEGNMQLPLKLA